MPKQKNAHIKFVYFFTKITKKSISQKKDSGILLCGAEKKIFSLPFASTLQNARNSLANSLACDNDKQFKLKNFLCYTHCSFWKNWRNIILRCCRYQSKGLNMNNPQ